MADVMKPETGLQAQSNGEIRTVRECVYTADPLTGARVLGHVKYEVEGERRECGASSWKDWAKDATVPGAKKAAKKKKAKA